MNITGLFSTDERLAILRSVIFRVGPFGVAEIARKAGVSWGLVSQFLRLMQKERLLRRAGTKFSVVENVRTAALRLLLNLSDLDFSVLKKSGFVKRAGIYGSFAKGTNNEHSDIDLWLLVEGASETELAGLTKVLKAMDGRIRPLYLTREKLERLKRDEKTFYHSLVFGSIDIYGDANEPI